MTDKDKVLTKEDLGHVGFGSAAHKALLGLVDAKDPEIKANLEEQLKAKPPTGEGLKKPVTRGTYHPRTSRSDGDPIFDGFRRVGR